MDRDPTSSLEKGGYAFKTVHQSTVGKGHPAQDEKVSVRDRSADASINRSMEGKEALSQRYHFRSTREIIRACEEGQLPDRVMFNFHPQRWTDSPALWAQELVMQNLKNVAKKGAEAGSGVGVLFFFLFLTILPIGINYRFKHYGKDRS